MRAESERRESSVTVSRRGILSGLIGIIAAPAIVRAASTVPPIKIDYDVIYLSSKEMPVKRFDLSLARDYQLEILQDERRCKGEFLEKGVRPPMGTTEDTQRICTRIEEEFRDPKQPWNRSDAAL